MDRLLWLSDLHLTDQKDGLQRKRLASALAQMHRDHPDAAACIITGDLSDQGTAEEYHILHDALAEADLPVWPLIGNHDARKAFLEAVPLPGAKVLQGFVQYQIETPSHDLLFLDTHIPGEDAGTLCDQRLAWLEDRLARSNKPALIFMHHPPGTSGLGILDTIGFIDEPALADILRGSRVSRIFAGHIHMSLHSVFAGVPVATLRSISNNPTFPVTTEDWDSMTISTDRHQYGLIRLERNQHFLHTFDLEGIE